MMTDENQILELDPSTELIFKGPFGGGASAMLSMRNPTDKKIGFKVMTTVPRHCRVKPNMGIINPRDRTTIELIFMPFTEELDWNRHKFMVQSLQLEDNLTDLSKLEPIMRGNRSKTTSTRLSSSYITTNKKSEQASIVTNKKSEQASSTDAGKEQVYKGNIEDLEKILKLEREKNEELQKELAAEIQVRSQNEEELMAKHETAKHVIKQDFDNNVASLQKQLIEEKERTNTIRKQKEQYESRCKQLEANLHREQIMEGASNDDSALNISFWEVSHCDVKINKRIGSGAWGYVAKGLYKEQSVAVKCLHPNIVSPHSLKLLKREVVMMAKIRHPCLLLFIAVSFDHPSGSPMIITELMECSLRDAYKRQGMLSGKSRIKIMIDVACALHYLHTHKEVILHRDVSSANVLVRETINNMYQGKLSDFGSANIARSAVTAGPGAMMYMAPEVPRETHFQSDATFLHQTTKIDVYSYGILLCEVFASEPQLPFPEIFSSLFESIRSQFPFMHEQILKCTSHDPANRPEIISVLQELRTRFTNIL